MAAKFWHVTLVVENMALMRDFYTRVIGLEETRLLFMEDSETGSLTPGAMRLPGLNEWLEVSWDVKIEEQQYRDEDHDLSLALMKFHNKPSEKPKSAMSPFFGGHVGYFVEDLPSVLHRMAEGQLGKIISACTALVTTRKSSTRSLRRSSSTSKSPPSNKSQAGGDRRQALSLRCSSVRQPIVTHGVAVPLVGCEKEPPGRRDVRWRTNRPSSRRDEIDARHSERSNLYEIGEIKQGRGDRRKLRKW